MAKRWIGLRLLDYSDFFAKPANWLNTTGETALTRHFAYLSLYDEAVPFDKQLQNIEGLGIYPAYDTTHVDISTAPFENSRCLYTTQSPGLAIIDHNTPIKFSQKNKEVWEYMLTTNIISSTNEIDERISFSVYPNSSSSYIKINSDEDLSGKTFEIFSLSGQTVFRGTLTNSKTTKIDISSFNNGIYYISVNKESIKFIKQ